jgi:hypothetical protein
MTHFQTQLDLLEFPTDISRHRKLFSLDKLGEFTNKYISKLIQQFGLSKVQSAIDNDDNPYDPIINYITCLCELGMLHELFFQSFASTNETVLSERLEYLAWAMNISIANSPKSKGVAKVPSLANGQIHIYFTWDNMEILMQRIWPIASQITNIPAHEVEAYLANLIHSNFKSL